MTNGKRNLQEAEQRSQFLIQQFLENRMSEAEADELSALWQRHPELERRDLENVFKFEKVHVSSFPSKAGI